MWVGGFEDDCEFSDLGRWGDGDSAVNRIEHIGQVARLGGRSARALRDTWTLEHLGREIWEAGAV